jgi:hypothetical protein
VTRTCSLAECGSPEAGCQSQLISYQSLDSCLTWTSTPFSVQCIHLRNLCPQLNLLTHPMHAHTHPRRSHHAYRRVVPSPPPRRRTSPPSDGGGEEEEEEHYPASQCALASAPPACRRRSAPALTDDRAR